MLGCFKLETLGSVDRRERRHKILKQFPQISFPYLESSDLVGPSCIGKEMLLYSLVLLPRFLIGRKELRFNSSKFFFFLLYKTNDFSGISLILSEGHGMCL